jgi:hypothetical protein
MIVGSRDRYDSKEQLKGMLEWAAASAGNEYGFA